MATPTPDESLDVYAKPFVPQALRAINEVSSQHVVPSLPVRWIDFPAYVRTFAGSSFLQADPPPHLPNSANGGDPHDELTPGTYHPLFKQALVEEAAALQRECDEHALYKVRVAPAKTDSRPSMFWLLVPGLRELSLRVEVGDIVHLRQLPLGPQGQLLFPSVRDPRSNAVVKVELSYYTQHASYLDLQPPIVRQDAVVWGIDRLSETLTLRFDGLPPMSMQFNVCFTVQVGRLGAMYRAIMNVQRTLLPEQSSWIRSILFPEESDGVLQKSLNKGTISWVMRDEQLNYEQIRAVDTVLDQKYGHVPYLISGPPGTGKTKTLVELALQIITEQPTSHLLVCAPSDPAADTLVDRLRKHLMPKQLLRLNAPSRSFPEVPMTVLPFCFVNDDMFSLPPLQQVMKYRIVVCTSRDAEILLRARLSNADLLTLEQGVLRAIHPENPMLHPQLHWTGLLIDEAAQATEPEACIPLSIVAPPDEYEETGIPLPSVVMAGDQHQLGPRTASKSKAMQTSLFERLLSRPLYAKHPLSRSAQTGGVMRALTQKMLPITRPAFANLIRNYRSHSAILATPSSLFYHNTLEPEAANIESLLPWKGWRGRRWPVLFATNMKQDEIEQDGGGWYNVSEAKMALRYAQSFLEAGLLDPKNICIMSPFRAQVKLLRKLAREIQKELGQGKGKEFKLRDLNIGPLEAFQGLESMLVILCTTRTRDRFIEQDLAKGLGVMYEPRRFNVALTRAKEGLIVIGNPALLRKDVFWGAFLRFCERNGLWESQDLSVERLTFGSENGTVSRLERQLIHKEEMANGDDSGLAKGVRELGVYEDEDAALWADGRAVEEALLAYGDADGDDADGEVDAGGGKIKGDEM